MNTKMGAVVKRVRVEINLSECTVREDRFCSSAFMFLVVANEMLDTWTIG